MPCSPALWVAAAKVLKEMLAASKVIVIGVITVVAAEEGAPMRGHLHRDRGSRSTVATGFSSNGPGLRRIVIRCNQPGHRHIECTAIITLNPNSTVR